MRLPTTTGVEKPSPRSFTCHSSFGPPAGHCLSRPVSFETPLRSGPRHCGQSAAATLTTHKAATLRASKHSTALTDSVRNLIFLLRGTSELGRRVLLSYDHH